jgi:hypothetical protein
MAWLALRCWFARIIPSQQGRKVRFSAGTEALSESSNIQIDRISPVTNGLLSDPILKTRGAKSSCGRVSQESVSKNQAALRGAFQ